MKLRLISPPNAPSLPSPACGGGKGGGEFDDASV